MAIVKPRIPGFQDGGNANEAPIGALPNEVADDVPAQLSEGEFVVPADVVRFIGLKRLMKMRDEAKAGLQRMAEIGQMGNAEAVGAKADESFGEDADGFESTIDDIMSEMDTEEQTQQAFAKGGAVGGPPWLTGYDMKKAPKNPVFDVRYFKHSDGRMMYVTFFNGKPMTPIPSGFTETEGPVEQQVGKEAEEEKKKTTPVSSLDQQGPGTENGFPTVTGTGPGGTITAADLSQGQVVSPNAVKGAAALFGLATGIPVSLVAHPFADAIAGFMTNQAGQMSATANQTAVAAELGLTPDNPIVAQHIDDLAGIMPGPATGQAEAISAGTAAANAAAAAGLSSESQAAAAQAAVNAVLGGTPSNDAISNAVTNAAASEAGVSIGGQPGMEGISDVGGPGVSADADSGVGPGVGDSVSGVTGDDGVGVYAKGGMVQRRKQPAKKQKKKGLASR